MNRKSKLIELTIRVPEHLLEQVEEKLEQKGSSVEDLIRTSMRRYVRMPDVFHLKTKMSFGQYKDELIETLVRLEPRYILWCMQNIHGFQLGEDARDLLDSLLPDEGLVVRKYEQGGDFEEIRVVPRRMQEVSE